MEFYLSLGGSTIQRVDSEVIEDTILDLEECAGDVLILEAESPIKKCNFIQAYYPNEEYDDGKGYEVELSLLNESSFRLYRYRTVDVREVITIF